MALVQEFWFDTEEGPRTLAELFDGRGQLLVPHFPFDAGWHAALPACTRAADRCERALADLNASGVALVAISDAPLDAIVACKWRMGWSFPWVSSLRTGFDAAVGVTFCGGAHARPALSAFALRDGAVHRTLSARRPRPRTAMSSRAPVGLYG
ncbi:DUF899 family protein [Conexibacter sp. CPCC 206217]|uniref:DUF899 family protein n=1 Tax=Conexibacter sp. CPCC 206217 TaxID=3064574 RepID=UPI00271E3EC4|nr:DUF899 family protein [Conexibacter sp. CPCC 206217]MDO8211208.1 DUF899 family protein [Conexibacter sp. CPCC 206217]